MILLSTPFGKRGHFFDEWEDGEGWLKVSIPATECPRITPAFLEQERNSLGRWWFEQEYLCKFVEAEDQVFKYDEIMEGLVIRSNHWRFFDPESESVFYCGLDLGQAKDYTAWSVVERRPGIPALYHIRSLNRFELGTSYPIIVKQVRAAIDSPAITPNLLVIDNTGVGRAISDLFRQEGLLFNPITITGGDKVNSEGGRINVPKRDLVSTIQVLLQARRLKIPALLPEAQTLLEE